MDESIILTVSLFHHPSHRTLVRLAIQVFFVNIFECGLVCLGCDSLDRLHCMWRETQLTRLAWSMSSLMQGLTVSISSTRCLLHGTVACCINMALEAETATNTHHAQVKIYYPGSL